MLRSQVGQHASRSLLWRSPASVARGGGSVTIHRQFFIDSIIRARYEAAKLLVALQHCDLKMRAVRSHLGYFRTGEWSLYEQVNLTGALHVNCSVGGAIFFGYTLFCKRSVLKLYVNFPLDGTKGCQTIDLVD